MKQKILIGLLIMGVVLGAVLMISELSMSGNVNQQLGTTVVRQATTSENYTISGLVKNYRLHRLDTEPDFISGADVSCSYKDKTGQLVWHRSTTNKNGEFIITNIPKDTPCVFKVVKVPYEFKDNPRLIKVTKDISDVTIEVVNTNKEITPDYSVLTRIEGTVSGPAAKKGVAVVCKGSNGYVQGETVTHWETGNFVMYNWGHNPCTLTASANGYTFTPESIEIKNEHAPYLLKDNDFVSKASGTDEPGDKITISGTAYEKTGEKIGDSITGVKVKVTCQQADAKKDDVVLSKSTDANGHYIINDIEKGWTCSLDASKDDLEFTNVPKNFGKMSESVDFDIFSKGKVSTETVKLTGTAMQGGEPLAGVKVVVDSCKLKTGSDAADFSKSDTTSADGTYSINGIPKGAVCHVRPSKKDLTFKEDDATLTFSDDKTFNPVANTQAAAKVSCVELGKVLAPEKSVLNFEDTNVLEQDYFDGKAGIDFNCDGKFSFADVTALSECTQKAFDVPCASSTASDPF